MLGVARAVIVMFNIRISIIDVFSRYIFSNITIVLSVFISEGKNISFRAWPINGLSIQRVQLECIMVA